MECNTKIREEQMDYTMIKEDTTNYAKIAGVVKDAPEKSHQVEGENFFEMTVSVKRLSEAWDNIPVTVSERTLIGLELKKGDFVEVEGEYRSYNKFLNEKSKLVLHMFAKEVKLSEADKFFNEVKLTGYLCKQPTLRVTPFSREICDVLVAVNRPNYHKSDYIPCIIWSRNARFIANQNIGCKINLVGRIQSREYKKEGEETAKVAYEVSVSKIEITENISKFKKGSEKESEVVN